MVLEIVIALFVFFFLCLPLLGLLIEYFDVVVEVIGWVLFIFTGGALYLIFGVEFLKVGSIICLGVLGIVAVTFGLYRVSRLIENWRQSLSAGNEPIDLPTNAVDDTELK